MGSVIVPVITCSIWTETRTTFIHNIATHVHTQNIPDKLIQNSNQIPSKFVPTSSMTMAEKGSKHVSVAGADNKRASTMILVESFSGGMLPFQVIYQGKTERCLPKVSLPKEFLVMYNEKHGSNEQATLRLIDHLIVPYITNVKAELNLPDDQKSLLPWDAFTAQGMEAMKEKLEATGIICDPSFATA